MGSAASATHKDHFEATVTDITPKNLSVHIAKLDAGVREKLRVALDAPEEPAAKGEPGTVDLPTQKSLDEVHAANPSSTWAETEMGRVHYKLYNEEARKSQTLLVMVHGFSGTTEQMAPVAETLAAKGVPVLTFDLFGRGWSDRPQCRHNGKLYTAGVVGLLKALNHDAQIDLFGFSMGGRVITHVAESYPDIVRKMIFFAPDGTRKTPVPEASRLFVLRYASDLMDSHVTGNESSSWQAYYKMQYGRCKASNLNDDEFEARMAEIVKSSEVDFKGMAYSMGSSMVDFTDESEEVALKRLEAVGKLAKPSIAIWGTADTDVPYAQHETLSACVPHCKVHDFKDKTHMFLLESDALPELGNIISEFVLTE